VPSLAALLGQWLVEWRAALLDIQSGTATIDTTVTIIAVETIQGEPWRAAV